MTLRESIYKLLQDDAKLHTGTELGSLLGHYGTAPYGVFFGNPPASPSLPLVTYFFSSQTGRRPREIYINITAWGNNFEAIQNRIYTLLHKATINSTDYFTLMLKWDWAGPEIFDDNLKCYVNQHRFIAKGMRL